VHPAEDLEDEERLGAEDPDRGRRREGPRGLGAVEALADRLVAEGFAERSGSQLRLLNRGRLLADTIGAELMGAFESEAVAR
jgi:hypothetical protein